MAVILLVVYVVAAALLSAISICPWILQTPFCQPDASTSRLNCLRNEVEKKRRMKRGEEGKREEERGKERMRMRMRMRVFFFF